MSASRGRTLILVENLSVPFDRRVWQEACSLRDAGYGVTVLCPRGEHDNASETIEGIEIHRYALRPARSTSAREYAREYGSALFRLGALIRRLDRSHQFNVVHSCNPPDVLFLPALSLRRRGAAFVFDHHDLVPELFLSRFEERGLLYRGTLLAERFALAVAHVVLSTNESYRRVAIERGKKQSEDVFVVRSAPDAARFRALAPDPTLRRGKAHLLAYLGVMGPQDGVDYAIRALASLRARRDDWRAIFVGGGDVLEQMRALARSLGLQEDVVFTGRVPDDDVVRILSSADVCLSPDPKNPLNDVSTMNKILEYMALSRPLVSFDLAEARVSAGQAALYAVPNDVEDFARRVEDLLDAPERRAAMGALGRERLERELSWSRSEQQLLAGYGRALARARGRR